jgi:hypothetical protein
MDEFEDPRVTELRPLLRQALEEAGHTVLDERTPVELPELVDRAVVGNLQSTDSNGVRHAYYIRPARVTPAIPDWISTIVRAAHDVNPAVSVYVVVERRSKRAVADAEACGAGLIVLRAGGRIERVRTFGPPTSAITDAEFDAAAERVRRTIVSKAEIEKSRAMTSFFEADAVAAGAGPASERRLRELRDEHAAWVAWEEDRLHELEAICERKNYEQLEAFAEGL